MEIINNKYKVDKIKLGSGGFSEVFLGTDITTDQQVAIKNVSLLQKSLQEEDMLNKLKFEIDLMQKLDHPNIVNYYDVVKTNTNWYIVMEYCNVGTLGDLITFNEVSNKKIINFNRETNTYYYLNQLKNALSYIRRLGYIHRDIKPMNVLLTKPNINNIVFDRKPVSIDKNLNYSENLIVKLADFGLAKYYTENDESLMNTICGSPLYMAPELILDRKYNSKADLWSFGIIMYQLLFGVHPNNANSFSQLINNLKQKNINFHLSKNFTPSCFDLLTKLLINDPDERIDWVNFVNHEWFLHYPNNKNLIVNPIREENMEILKQNKESLKNMSPKIILEIGSLNDSPNSLPWKQ